MFEVISPNSIGLSFEVKNIYNGEGEKVEKAPHPQETIVIDCPFELSEGDILRKR